MRLDPAELRRRLVPIRGPGGGTAEQPPQAAVFVLFVTRRETRVLLIRRARRGDPWSGQIAFPGGRVDAADADALAAAYREAYEEVGVSRGHVEYLGPLGSYFTLSGAVQVHAFAGAWDGGEALAPDGREVDAIIEHPVEALWAAHRDGGFHNRAVADIGDGLAYPLGETPIWGVTARIIHHVLECVAESLR